MTLRDFVRRLGVLMATVFVDMLGFFIVLPLLPFYAEKLGADPVKVGALVSTFALGQVALSPLWGRLSDRYGRRPVILVSLAISAVAYVLFESAGTVWLLFLSRFVQGAGAGNIGVVQAYVSDTVPPADRAKAIGWLTAATSAGVMMGPAVGSLAKALDLIGPGYLAAGLCLLNMTFGFFWLPESRSPQKARSEKPVPRGATRRAFKLILREPRGAVGSLVWVYAGAMMAFMAMNAVLALYLERVFGITEDTIGWFFVYVGGVSLLMRTLILGPAVRWLGEVRVLRAGAVAIALGMATIPLARNLVELGVAILLIPVGTALLFPVTTSLISAWAPEGQTGMLLGVQQAFGGISRLLGPLWAGAAFQHWGIRSPFWVAAGMMVALRFFAGGVSEDQGSGRPIPEPAPGPPTEPAGPSPTLPGPR